MSTTPNMNLTLPTVSQTPGPTWANQINADLSVLDAHNHNPLVNGGVAITTAALSIDADLSFGSYSALSLASAEFANQITTPAASRVYVTGGDLWYSYDGVTPVQITSGSAIVGAPGNIVGMGGTNDAAVIYNDSTKTFTFWSDQAPPAMRGILDVSQVTFRATAAASPVTVNSSALASTYTLTLPTAPPGSPGLVGFASSGALSPVLSDGTLSITSSTIGIAALAVNTGQIASGAVTQAKMQLKSAAYSAVTSPVTVNGPASTVVKQLTGQTYTAGRPVYICLTGLTQDSTTPDPVSCLVVGTVYLYLLVTHPGGLNTHFSFTPLPLNDGIFSPPISVGLPAVSGFFNVQTTGTHTISLICYIPSSGSSLVIDNVAIEAFQL